MTIIEPSANLISELDLFKKIELAGRVCYKSEGNIRDNVECKCKDLSFPSHCLICDGKKKAHSSRIFVGKVIENTHFSVLEHGILHAVVNMSKLAGTDGVSNVDLISSIKIDSYRNALSFSTNNRLVEPYHLAFISGNIRRWKEAIETPGRIESLPFKMIAFEMKKRYSLLFCKNSAEKNRYDIDKSDASSYVKIYDGDELPLNYTVDSRFCDIRNHQFRTLRIIHDRALLNELIRHRQLSPSQKSTRFCNEESKSIQFLKPIELNENALEYEVWKKSCSVAERSYKKLIRLGVTPQNARAVLPLSLASEIVLTGSVYWWQNVIDQRGVESAHPDMHKSLARHISNVLKLLPGNKYGKPSYTSIEAA